MTTRLLRKYRHSLVIGGLTFGMLLLWIYPAGAVKVVRENSQQVETEKKPATDQQPKDGKSSTTKTLLDDVESQKKKGTSRGHDVWIDKNGDGKNDNLKTTKTHTAPKTRVKESKPATIHNAVPTEKSKPAKEAKDDSTTKKRR